MPTVSSSVTRARPRFLALPFSGLLEESGMVGAVPSMTKRRSGIEVISSSASRCENDIPGVVSTHLTDAGKRHVASSSRRVPGSFRGIYGHHNSLGSRLSGAENSAEEHGQRSDARRGHFIVFFAAESSGKDDRKRRSPHPSPVREIWAGVLLRRCYSPCQNRFFFCVVDSTS